MNDVLDLIVIGGGINGTAIAADAAGRGLSVLLCEKNDLASGTSSTSTKLIHGGVRYLELYEFNLVRKALCEREILMRRAPNLITPLEFILPYAQQFRPAWLIRLGLFFYDHLSKRNTLPSSRTISLIQDAYAKPLKDKFKKGFSYYDCFTDDARLVVLNALSIKESQGTVLTRTEFVAATRDHSIWHVCLQNIETGKEKFYKTKGLINAAGPWVNKVQTRINNATQCPSVNLDKGSHIIVPKLYEGCFAYILQNEDKRIIFAIPYQEQFTLIGTTDVEYTDNLEAIHITKDEINYLCNSINSYFKNNISPKDVIHSYAGVRCLQNSSHIQESKLTRDYKFILDDQKPPFLLTIIGGKLTTHRILAEEALDLLKPFFPTMRKAWTGFKPLPGCNFSGNTFQLFYEKLVTNYPHIPAHLLLHYARNYGTYAYLILENGKFKNNLGQALSSYLYECEVNYLVQNEWAKTVDDIIWRRTKFGLFMSEKDRQRLSLWLQKHTR